MPMVPPSFLEHLIWVKQHVLAAIFDSDYLLERLVLKGGTAIELHLDNALGRSSLDIDLSLQGDLDIPVEALKRHLAIALQKHFESLSYTAFDITLDEKPHPRADGQTCWPNFWGGYRCELKLMETARFKALAGSEARSNSALTVGPRQQRKFKVEISKHEFVHTDHTVERVLPDGSVVFVYSIPLIITEKLRAICQQMPAYSHGHKTQRSRDYFDICRLLDHAGDDATESTVASLLDPVFAIKDVSLALLEAVGCAAVRDFHRSDFTDKLRDTVPNASVLQPFDSYVDRVVAFVDAVLSAARTAVP